MHDSQNESAPTHGYAIGPVSFALDAAGFDAAQMRRLEERLACVRVPLDREQYGRAAVGVRLRAGGMHPLRYDDGVFAAPGGEWVLRHDFTLIRDEHLWLGECVSLALSAEYALRWAAAVELLPRDGLLLHASSVRIEDRAHVFLGASGVGKSTIAFESDCDAIFTDELTVVAPDPHSGVWTVWPSPFWGQVRDSFYTEPAPLAGLWLLQGRETTAIVDVGAAEGVMGLYARVIDIAAAQASHPIVLDILGDLVEAVPVRRLSWRLGDPIASRLAAACSGILEVTPDDVVAEESTAPVFDFPASFSQ